MNVNVRVTGGEFSFLFFFSHFGESLWSFVSGGRGQPNQRTLLEGKKEKKEASVRIVRFTIVGCLLVKTADP